MTFNLVQFTLIVLAFVCWQVKAAVVVDDTNCPMASLLSNTNSTTNYTELMIANPSQFHCDKMPNSVFDYYPDGVLFTASLFTTVINIENTNTSFCVNSERSTNQRICEALFSNETLSEVLFLPYLESLRRNFSKYDGFKSPDAFFNRKQAISLGNFSTNYNSLVHSFNYCMYCREGNPLFDTFHTELLPRLVQKSAFPQVKTMNVLFEDFKKNFGEGSIVPFFNRTVYTFCKNSKSEFTALSQFACHDGYVTFWTPFSAHLSFKIIELFLFFGQFIVGVVLVLVPLVQRNIQKWRKFIAYVNDRKVIENSQLEKVKKLEMSSVSPSSFNSSGTDSPGVSPTMEPVQRKEPKKETILEVGLRVACDLNLLSATNMILSLLCNTLVALTFITITYYKGTCIFSDETFNLEMVSVELLVLANVPLALTFLSVLMKLDKTKRRVSLYAM